MKLFAKKEANPSVSWKNAFRTRAFKAGGYSIAAIAIVLVAVIAVNILVGALPSAWTSFDTSPAQLFTLSDQSKTLVKSLSDKVEIIWVVRSGYEDSTVGNLLDEYEGSSSKITVSKLDPDVNPTFLNQYGITSSEDNTLLVICGDRYRFVGSDEIYEYDYSNYYTTGEVSTSFAGEGAVTSAVSYVISEDLPVVYLLTGHGESELTSEFSGAVASDNVDTEDLNLLTVSAVPEDADAVLVNSPQSDLSAAEVEMLRTYLQNGGSLFLLAGPLESGSLTNLEALMAEYGMTAEKGIVVEGDQSHYASNYPYYLLPNIHSHEITSGVQTSGYYVFLPLSRGLHISDSLPDGLTVTKLLSTSDSAYSKENGFNMTTFEKESGDIDGPFVLAAAAEDANTGAQVVWVSSPYLVDDQVNTQVSGGNQDVFISAINWLSGHEDGVSIHSKNLDYEYITMDTGTAALLIAVVVVIIPAAYLVIGIVKIVRRKRK